METNIEEEFGGVFYFTNPTKQERKYLWNNKEYTFPAESTVPLIILSESLENIQEIRKRFAFRMAEERYYEGDEYKKNKEMGGGLPPTFDPKILEPMIQECLKPLAKARATVSQGKKIDDDNIYKASKAVGNNEDLNRVFAEESANAPVLGVMPDK